MSEIIKSFFLGIIQGITEWLPISSTGHMILFNSWFSFDETCYSGGREFVELFMTLIQFGSMLAIVFLFYDRLNIFSKGKIFNEKRNCLNLWKKIILGSIPAAVVGLIFKDFIHKYFYNSFVVSFMLILYGFFFLLVEKNLNNNFKISKLNMLDYKTVFLIGIFQTLALVPGTSRSGATILGALLLSCSRAVGAEFSFFLAIPTIAGASLLEVLSYFKHNGIGFSPLELAVLTIGFVVSFIVSIFVVSIFMKYIKKNNFKVFAYYRILIGLIFIYLAIFKKDLLKMWKFLKGFKC